MITILPYGDSDDQRSISWNRFEHVHAHALIPNEAMLQSWVVGMSPFYSPSFHCKGVADFLLHLCLGRPTYLIGRKAQISARDKIDFILGSFWRIRDLGNLIVRHDYFPFSLHIPSIPVPPSSSVTVVLEFCCSPVIHDH